MKTFKISPDVSLHMIKTNKFKNSIICLLFRQPLKRDSATINALIPRILSRGSENYGSISIINSVTESMYGSFFDAQIIKKGEEQILQFVVDAIDNHDELKIQVLEFLADIVMHPMTEDKGFNSEYTRSEKELLKIDIDSRKNNKAEYAKLRCLEEMCKDEPFGIYGDGYLEDVDALTPKQIFTQYEKILATSPIEFIVAGNEDEKFFINHLERIFNFKKGNRITLERPEFKYDVVKVKQIKETMEVNQGKICIGFRSGINPVSDEFFHLMAFNELLGGSGNSRLFLNVREKESLCYYINSFIYRFKTIIFIQSGVESKNFDRVIELVQQEIEQIKRKKFTKKEFENAKSSLIKKYQGIQDYQSAVIDFSISQKMLGDESDIEAVISKIEKVKQDEVVQITEKLALDTIYTLSDVREGGKADDRGIN